MEADFLSELKNLLGKKVAKLRKGLKLTQAAFAEKIDISVSALADIEAGANYPRPETVEKIKDACNIDYSDLFNFYDSKNVDEIYKEIQKSVNHIYKHNSELLGILKVFIRLLMK